MTMNLQLKESKIEVPSTSMAAHLLDEEVEIEIDEGTDINETINTQNANGVALGEGYTSYAFPVFVPCSNYSQVSSFLTYLFFCS